MTMQDDMQRLRQIALMLEERCSSGVRYECRGNYSCDCEDRKAANDLRRIAATTKAEGAQAPVAWLYPRNKFSGKEDDFEVCKMQPENRHKVGAFPVYTAPQSLPDSALVRAFRQTIGEFGGGHVTDSDWNRIEQRAREIAQQPKGE